MPLSPPLRLSAGAGVFLHFLGLVATPVLGLDTHRRTFTGCLSQCRVIPGDAHWPGQSAWNTLNTTVGGRLIETFPIAQVCHDPNYSEEECQFVADNWVSPFIMLVLLFFVSLSLSFSSFSFFFFFLCCELYPFSSPPPTLQQ